MVRAIAAPLFSQTVRLPFSKIAGINTFGVMYSRKCVPFFWSSAALNDRRKVTYEQMQDRFQARLAQGSEVLWWNVSSNTVVAKKVVRSWLSRRLRVAMRNALKSKGLDEHGRATQAGATPIAGTLQLHALGPLVMAKMVDVQREAERVVDHIRARG